MNNNRLDKLTDGIITILRLLLGDPKARVPTILITLGATGVVSPWWLPIVYGLAAKQLELKPELLDKAEASSFWAGWALLALGIAGWIWLVARSPKTENRPRQSENEQLPSVNPNPDSLLGVFKVVPDNNESPNAEAETPAIAVRIAKALANEHNTRYRVYLMNSEGRFTQLVGAFPPEK